VNLHFHRAVQTDLRLALEYFDREGGPKLGDRFFAEVQATKDRIAAHPERFGFFKDDLRRAKLRVFRYHVLFRIVRADVRVLVLRHNRRHPEFGLTRR
jgi:plasmid stabilization system protein ParE